MRTKFSVGQVVYLASPADQAVYRRTVAEIVINSTKPGAGGQYRYDMDGFTIGYRLNDGAVAFEADNWLHDSHFDAFGSIESPTANPGA